MVALSRVKERTETDLSDAELQSMIDEAQAEINARFGAAISKRDPNAVSFDGSSSRISIATPLIGIGGEKKGIFSCWVNLNGNNGFDSYILNFGAAGNKLSVKRNVANKFQIIGSNSAGTVIIDIETLNTFTKSATWVHLLGSWDLDIAGSGRLYTTDVSDFVENTFTADDIDLGEGPVSVGSSTLFADFWNGCLADLYFNSLEHLDLDLEANRRLFIDSNSMPVDLGTDGSTPTGASPVLFFTGATDIWNTNKGFGRSFTVAGAVLADCDTGPRDPSGARDITVFIGDDPDLDGYRTFLDLTRPLFDSDFGKIVVTEIDHTTETVIAADDFRVINNGRTLQRLSDGTNPRQFWQRLVKVVYTPVSDIFERDEIIILLVLLGIEYRGLKSEKTGDHASSFMDYAAERNALMGRLSPRRGILMA